MDIIPPKTVDGTNDFRLALGLAILHVRDETARDVALAVLRDPVDGLNAYAAAHKLHRRTAIRALERARTALAKVPWVRDVVDAIDGWLSYANRGGVTEEDAATSENDWQTGTVESAVAQVIADFCEWLPAAPPPVSWSRRPWYVPARWQPHVLGRNPLPWRAAPLSPARAALQAVATRPVLFRYSPCTVPPMARDWSQPEPAHLPFRRTVPAWVLAAATPHPWPCDVGTRQRDRIGEPRTWLLDADSGAWQPLRDSRQPFSRLAVSERRQTAKERQRALQAADRRYMALEIERAVRAAEAWNSWVAWWRGRRSDVPLGVEFAGPPKGMLGDRVPVRWGNPAALFARGGLDNGRRCWPIRPDANCQLAQGPPRPWPYVLRDARSRESYAADMARCGGLLSRARTKHRPCSEPSGVVAGRTLHCRKGYAWTGKARDMVAEWAAYKARREV